MIKLTDLDKQILFELDKDGRASYSEIARALQTSPQVVKYRFERLMDHGAIKNFWAFIDYDRAGYSFFWAYWLKFQGLTKEKEEEIFASFRQNKYMPIVMRTDGYADAMICITTKDVFHHNEILNKFFSDFGKYISMSDMVVGLGFKRFPRSYLLGQENTEKTEFISGGSTKTADLTKTDRQIMSLLQQDGRMEFTEIAKILNVSVSLVHDRLKRLNQKKVITKTTYTLNHKAIGYKLYRVLFRLMQSNQDMLKEIYDYCAVHPNINNYVPVMGNWQMMIDVEIKNREGLRDLLREMKNIFRKIIAQVEVNEIYKVEKFSQMVIEYPNLIK